MRQPKAESYSFSTELWLEWMEIRLGQSRAESGVHPMESEMEMKLKFVWGEQSRIAMICNLELIGNERKLVSGSPDNNFINCQCNFDQKRKEICVEHSRA